MNILQFFSEYGYLILIFISFIFNIILFIKTGNKKYIKEVYDMIYRKENYQDTVVSKNKDITTTVRDVQGETFSKLKPVYRLNKVSGELEKTEDFIDVQEVIDSCSNQCLNNLMQRFFPDLSQTSNDVVEFQNFSNDLDMLTETFSIVEEYKEKYNLPIDYSPSQVFDFINKKKSELNDKINNINLKKEVVIDEKEIVEESKQA